MTGRSRIAWKLNIVFATIIVVVVVVSGYLNNMADNHYALESAREVSKFNSQTILTSLRDRMMTRDNASIRERIRNLTKESSFYTDIQLVAHGGEVVASRRGTVGDMLTQKARPCRVCHSLPDVEAGLSISSHDEVIELRNGERIVSVMTPIFNEPSCQTAACHVHEESTAVLGLLQVDSSLAKVDALISSRNLHTIIAVLLAVGLSTVAMFFLTSRLLGRPIQTLTNGVRKIASNDFGFRFKIKLNDEFASLATSFNDMSSRISTALSELRNTKDYLEGIIENSADIIITVNPDGFIETFNSGAEKSLGYQREEVIGQRIEMLFADPLEREVAIRQLQHTDNVVNYETHFLTKDGEVRHVILTLSRLRDPDGQPIGTFGISKDITEEKRLQEQLIVSERFAAIGQAFTGIQHGMKNMLNALKGGAYMVKIGLAKNDLEMLRDGWAIVQEGIGSLTEMSSHLLNYVKEWRPEFKQVEVSNLVGGATKIFKQTAIDKGVDLQTRISDGVKPVLCDDKLITSAVVDLLSNALDACLEKEYDKGETPVIEVRVDTSTRGEFLLIEVQDNGCGMSEAVKANIFTPFFSTKNKRGTGLGLALTSRVISVHGGAIRVESASNQGSKFCISLPVSGPNQDKEDIDGEKSADR